MSRNAPVYLVTVEMEATGQKFQLDLTSKVTFFEYEDTSVAADKLTLRVDNWNLSNFDDPIWRKGNFVTVSWGYEESMSPPRRCQIRKVTGFTELNIEAHGVEVLLNTEVKNRIFENMKRSDVVRQIANEWGYREERELHIEDTVAVVPHVQQARLTDAQFLRRLAHLEGFEWWIDFDGFHFHQRDLAQPAVRVYRYDDDPALSEFEVVNIENDITGKPGTVVARGRDSIKRRTIDAPASHETETKRPVLGKVVDAPGTDSPKEPGFVSTAHKDIHPTSQQDDVTAQRAAAGKFRRAQQVAVKMAITMVGDPNMLAKSVIVLDNLGKRLSQPYYVRSVKHTIAGSYKMTAKIVSDGTGGHSTVSQLATEANAINVGPALKGRRTENPRRTIDTPEGAGEHKLKPVAGKDSDGKPVHHFVDKRHRE